MIIDKEAKTEPKSIKINDVRSVPDPKEAIKGLDLVHEDETKKYHLKAIEIIKPLIDLLVYFKT